MAAHGPLVDRQRLIAVWRTPGISAAAARQHSLGARNFRLWIAEPPSRPVFLELAATVAGSIRAHFTLEIDGHHVTFGESLLPSVIRTGDPRHGRRVTGLPHRNFFDPEPVDMQTGFARLAARVTSAGHLFVFLSKRRTDHKALSRDTSGRLLLFKRAEDDRFHLPALPPEPPPSAWMPKASWVGAEPGTA